MPQAKVAQLAEAAWQHVLEEAAHELVAAEVAGSRAPGLALLVSDGDRFVIETDDPGISESDAEETCRLNRRSRHGISCILPRLPVKIPRPFARQPDSCALPYDSARCVRTGDYLDLRASRQII
jgi:hypothetical protein